MSRAESQSQDHFDLLPFIAIMMCVLGCLLLVTLSMASFSMGLGSGETWVVDPNPDAVAKQPVLFEWDGKATVVHRDNQLIRIGWNEPQTKQISIGGHTYELGDDEHDPNPTLTSEILRLAQHRETQYALISVRPSGFASFYSFAHAFRRQNVTIGFEPIGQDKPVKLQSPAAATARRKEEIPHETQSPQSKVP